jgi:hypothetical protein
MSGRIWAYPPQPDPIACHVLWFFLDPRFRGWWLRFNRDHDCCGQLVSQQGEHSARHNGVGYRCQRIAASLHRPAYRYFRLENHLGYPLSFVIRDRPEQYGYLPDGNETGDPLPEIAIRNKGMEIGLKQALRMRSFWYLNAIELIRMMTVLAVITHVMPYLSSLAISRSTGGLIAGAIPLFSIIGRFGFGWLGDAMDKRYALALSFCLMSIGLLVFCYVQVIWVACVFLLLFSPGYGGGMVIRGAILREYFGRDSFGKILGIIMGCAAVGGIIGPTLAGWVFDMLGSYQPIWLIFFGLTGLTTLLTLRIWQVD